MAWTDPFAPPPPLTEPPGFNEEEEERKRQEKAALEAEPEAGLEFVEDENGAYWPIAGALAPTDIPSSQYSKATSAPTAIGAGLGAGFNMLGGSMWKLAEVAARAERNVFEGIESIAPSHITPEKTLYESPLKRIARGLAGIDKEREDAYRELADIAFSESGKISQKIGDDTTSKVLGTIAQAVPSLLPALATGGLGGGTTLVALVAGGQSFGQHANSAENHLTRHYQELGMSEEDAKNKAAVDALIPSIAAGVMTAALIKAVPWGFKKVTGSSAGYGGAETLGMNMLTKQELKEGMELGFTRLAARGAIGESVEESLDEIYQGYLEMGWWNPDKSHKEVLYGGLVAGLVGGFLGGGMSGISLASIQNASIIETGKRAALHYKETGETTLPEADLPAAPDTSKLKATGSPVTAAAVDAAATGTETEIDPAAAVEGTTAAASSTIEGVLPKSSRFESQPIDGATDVVESTDPDVVESTEPDVVESTEPLRDDWGRYTKAKALAEAAIAEGTITVEEVNALESLRDKEGGILRSSPDAHTIKALIDSKKRAAKSKEEGRLLKEAITGKPQAKPKDTTLSRRVDPKTRAEELQYKINNLNEILNARGAGKTEQQKADVAEKKAQLQEAKDELAAIESGEQSDPGPQETKVRGQGPEAKKAAIDAKVKSGEVTEEEAAAKKAREDALFDQEQQLEALQDRREAVAYAQQRLDAATDAIWDNDGLTEEEQDDALKEYEEAEKAVEIAEKELRPDLVDPKPKPEDSEPVGEEGDKGEAGVEEEVEEEEDPVAGPTEVRLADGAVIVDTSSVNNNDPNVKMALAVIEENLVPAQEALSDNFPAIAVELDPNASAPVSVNPKDYTDVIIINPNELAVVIDLAASGHGPAAKFIAGMDVVFEEELFHLIDAEALHGQWSREMASVRPDRVIEFGEWYDAHNERIYNDMSSAEKTKVLREYLGDRTDVDSNEKTMWETTYKYLVNPKNTPESGLALRRIEVDHGGMSNLHEIVAGEYVRMRMQSKRGKRKESNESFYNDKNEGLGEWFFMAHQAYVRLKEDGYKGWIGDSDLVGQRVKNAVAIIDQTGVTETKPVKKKTVKKKTALDSLTDEVDSFLGAKRIIPSLSSRKKIGPVETSITAPPHFPDDDPQWNGMLARERPMGATDSAEFAAAIYQDLYDYLGVANPLVGRHSVTFDDNQTYDALHWTWSRTLNNAKRYAQKNNNSLKSWSYGRVRKGILTDFLKHITAATREYGGLVTMSAQQALEADANILAALDRIDDTDADIAVVEEWLLKNAKEANNPDASLEFLETYDKETEDHEQLLKRRRKEVKEYYKLERRDDRQRYKKISMQDKEGGSEDEEGIAFDEIFGGDVLISGATQNMEASDINTVIRTRIQEAINALPNILGRATVASVRMTRVIDRTVDGASMTDIARELGVSVKTVQTDMRSARALMAKYAADRGWASPEKWVFSPAERSGKQGTVRASFDVRVAESTEIRSDSTEAEIRKLEGLQRLFGEERIFLHDDMRFRRTGGLGAKNPLAVAAARLGVAEADIQKEVQQPSNPRVAVLSDEEMTEVVRAADWHHGTSLRKQALINKEGFIVPKNRLATVATGVFMAADSKYAESYADKYNKGEEGTVERYGVNLQKVLNGDAPSIDSNGKIHPAVNEAFSVVAKHWSDLTGGFSGRFDLAKETAIETYARADMTVAQAIEDSRFLGDQLMELDEFSEIDQFSSDDTEARVEVNRVLRDKLGYDGLFFTHPEKTHTELTIFREPEYAREDSLSTAEAIRNLSTGLLAAKSPVGLAAKSPVINLKVELGRQLDRIAESNAYGTVAGWMEIGGEDLLLSHPNATVRGLAPLIRQHYDTRQTLEAKLLSGLNKAEDALTINEKEAARKEFHDYIALREAGQNLAKVLGKGAHSEVALQKAQEAYDSMSDNGKALVNWAHDIAEMTGGINEALDVHVKDGQHWRPIGNLGMLHFPRMLTPKTAKLIFEWAEENDGTVRKPEYAQLLRDIVANGNAESVDAAHDMIQGSGINSIKSNEFLEGVEMARGIKLPDVNSATGEPYYDYSINGYVNFLSRYSDRIAQIQTFGQSRGGAMTTAWDVVLGEKVSGDIKKDIDKIQDAIEGRRVDSPATNWMLSIAGAGLLGSPLGSLRNFYTGVFFTAEQAGVVEAAKATGTVLSQYGMSLANALVDFHKSRKRVLEGEGKLWYLTPSLRGGEWAMKTPEAVAEALAGGAIAQDIVNSMLLDIQQDSVWNDEETTAAKMRSVNRKTLFLHNTAERMARATNYIGAMQWLRTNAILIKGEKGAWKSRIAAMKRMGMTDADIDAVIDEKSWALEKGARMAVREKQYSYDVTQTPQLFHGKNSHIGRLMFQFQRWGFQRSRDLYRNIILPAIGEEKVTWKGQALGTGTSLSGKPVVRDLGPLVRMLALMVGSGELYGLLREVIKGKDRTELDLKHIYATAGDSKDRALMAAFERLVMDSAMSGALGISSDYAMLTRDMATRGPRYKSPFKPPSFKIAEDTIGLISNRVQRGWDGLKGEGLGDDVLDYLSSFPTFQQAGVLATRAGIPSLIDSVPVVEWAVRDNPSARLKNSFDSQRLRNLIRDYSGEMNLNIRYGGQHPLNENSYDYRRMKNSLSAGDLNAATKVKRSLLTEGESRKMQLRAMKQSVRQSQPLNAYGVKSDVERKNFVKWLRKRLGNAEATELLEVQRRYVRTAKLAGVMD